MKKRKRVGGVIRLLILLIVLAAAAAIIRMAAGKIASGRTDQKAAEPLSSTETDSAAYSSAQESAPDDSFVQEEYSRGGSTLAASSESEDGSPDDIPQDMQTEGTDGSDSSADAGSANAGATTASGTEDTESAYDHAATELEIGQAYLASLEQRTPVEMEYMISEAQKEREKELQREAYRKRREEYRQSLEGQKLWDSFDDFVFLGDSRVVGYDVFGFLPSDRVLAEAGDTINSITNRMDTIKSLSPKYIFISYGINDIGIGFWPTAEEYTDALREKLHELQKEVPDAEIYVNSIIPARDDAAQTYTVWQGLPEYSEAIRLMCEEEGIPFIDNGAIIEEHKDLYATDGVHLQPDFYRYWAENQLLGVYDHENGVLSF